MNWFIPLSLSASLAISLTLTLFASEAKAVTYSPRIGIQKGRFFDEAAQKEFRPIGFHYVRLRADGAHYVFAPGLYDAAAAEALMVDLDSHGFNLVRVFLGNIGVAGPDGVSDAFLANLCDFLERARAHGVHVLLVPDWMPDAPRYSALKSKGDAAPQGTGQPWLDSSWLEAKSLYLTDLATAIRKEGLLSTVFAWEFENEVAIHLDQIPFSSREPYRFLNHTYDLATGPGVEALASAGITNAAHRLTTAVHSVDPLALTSFSVFTPRAVGRLGAADNSARSDPRLPVSPLALADADLSYVDIHFYGPSPEALAQDLRSIEWPELHACCLQRGKPLFIGEFGTFHIVHPREQDAAFAMHWYLDQLFGLGFQGALFWTYNCEEQKELWNAKSGQGLIFRELKAFTSPR